MSDALLLLSLQPHHAVEYELYPIVIYPGPIAAAARRGQSPLLKFKVGCCI